MTFEFDQGFVIVARTAEAVPDGSQLEINADTYTFRFGPDDGNPFTIDLDPTDTAEIVAQKVAAAAAGSTTTVIRDGNRVNLPFATLVVTDNIGIRL